MKRKIRLSNLPNPFSHFKIQLNLDLGNLFFVVKLLVHFLILEEKISCYYLQDYNSNDIFYQNNCLAPTRDEINDGEDSHEIFSIDGDHSFCYSGQSRIKNILFSLQKYMFCIHCTCFIPSIFIISEL